VFLPCLVLTSQLGHHFLRGFVETHLDRLCDVRGKDQNASVNSSFWQMIFLMYRQDPAVWREKQPFEVPCSLYIFIYNPESSATSTTLEHYLIKTLSSRGLFEHNSRLFKFCTTLTCEIHVSKQFVLFRSHVFMITWQVGPSQ